jgi:hypothetical protein
MNYVLALVCFGVGLFFLREAVMVWRSPEFRRDLARLREQRAAWRDRTRKGSR